MNTVLLDKTREEEEAAAKVNEAHSIVFKDDFFCAVESLFGNERDKQVEEEEEEEEHQQHQQHQWYHQQHQQHHHQQAHERTIFPPAPQVEGPNQLATCSCDYTPCRRMHFGFGPALPRGSLRGAFGGHHHNQQQQQHTWKKEQNMHCVRKRTKRGYDIDFTFMASKNRDPFRDPFEIELYFNKHALPPQLQHNIRMIQELNSIIFRRRWKAASRTIEGQQSL